MRKRLPRITPLLLALFLGVPLSCGKTEGESATTEHNGFIAPIAAGRRLRSLDLLLVVDNSPSMADKQALLAEAIPALVARIIAPDCVNSDATTSPNPGVCPEGSAAEFEPYDDIHIGVITPSLGGHGSSSCPRDEEGNDDRGRFIPIVREGVVDPDGTGFLHWNVEDSAEKREAFIENVRRHVAAVGTTGCEAPAQMEAWYRALVDPTPPVAIVLDDGGQSGPLEDSAGTMLVDEELLLARERFLRPDQMLSIVVVSDQDDCSLMDGDVTYPGAELGHVAAEGLNGLCFDLESRFGANLRYPPKKYVDALTKPIIVNQWTGEEASNPLLRGAGENAGRVRDPGLVFFTGLIGVPWQTIATDESLIDPATMQLRTSTELTIPDIDVNGAAQSRWDIMLSDPPLDPFLTLSVEPRTAGLTHPIAEEQIVDEGSNNPTANNINGHEFAALDEEDELQAACIFPLRAPIDCDASDATCLCSNEPSRNRAACQSPLGGAATTTQHWAEAKPAPRILDVLHGLGTNAVVGSICPKISTATDASDPNYGFNPAGRAMTRRLVSDSGSSCARFELPVEESGKTLCTLVEAWPEEGNGPTEAEGCSEAGRSNVDDVTRELVQQTIEASGRCGGSSGISCDNYRMCFIDQLTGEAREACLVERWPDTSEEAGFCYIDADKTDESGNYVAGGPSNPVVSNCPQKERRMLNLVGEDVPRPSSLVFLLCEEDLERN